MALENKDVQKIAHLARLEISEQEIATYAGHLSRILGLIEQMNAVDTAGVAPMAHPLEAGMRLREDVVTESDHRERFQAIAPELERHTRRVAIGAAQVQAVPMEILFSAVVNRIEEDSLSLLCQRRDCERCNQVRGWG